LHENLLILVTQNKVNNLSICIKEEEFEDTKEVIKGNNKITELRTILQRESQIRPSHIHVTVMSHRKDDYRRNELKL
jgi:hypothetical protein